MSKIYCMSDIHGHLAEFEAALEFILPDFGDSDRLILLGDYIDCGESSCEVIRKIMELQTRYSGRVIALRGNHEQMFVDYLGGEFSILETGAETWRSFLDKNVLEKTKILAEKRDFFTLSDYVRDIIKRDHAEIADWLNALPYYYETQTQIFVHAGVDENEGKLWNVYPDKNLLLAKFPETTGKFYKTIIAGHIGTYSIIGDKNFHGIFYDGESHFYCDGTVQVSGVIPVLAYDTETDKYFSPNSNIRTRYLS